MVLFQEQLAPGDIDVVAGARLPVAGWLLDRQHAHLNGDQTAVHLDRTKRQAQICFPADMATRISFAARAAGVGERVLD